ncbi:MAG: RNA methyltransferase, partial [Clostridia bacterium]
MVITSKSNNIVKHIKSLYDKKFRVKYNEYFLEGIKVIDELLDYEGAVNVKFIAYSYDTLISLKGGNDLIKKIDKLNIEKYLVDDNIINYLTDTTTTQGIVAVCNIKKNNNILDTDKLLIIDKVSDLGNLGSILRSCLAFDFKNIILINGCADIYSPKLVRASMSSIFKVNVGYYDYDIINKIKSEFYILGTSLYTNNYLEDYKFLNKKYAIVIGNESNGISDICKNMCDELVKINIKNVES